MPTRTLRNGPPARAAAPAVPPVPTQARPAVRARVGDDAAEVAALRTRQGHAVAANTRRNADEDANAAPASHDEDDDDDNNHNNNNASNNNASVNGSVAAAAPRRIASNSTVRATAAAAAAEHRATVARNRGTVRATTRNRGSANAAAQAAYQQGGTVAGPSGSRRNPTRATAALAPWIMPSIASLSRNSAFTLSCTVANDPIIVKPIAIARVRASSDHKGRGGAVAVGSTGAPGSIVMPSVTSNYTPHQPARCCPSSNSPRRTRETVSRKRLPPDRPAGPSGCRRSIVCTFRPACRRRR